MAGTQTTAAFMARFLKRAGINHVFGYPGDPNLEFMEAVRLEDMMFVLARREGTAAFMADACGQITGLPGVCMSTLGPGSTSIVNGVATAYLDRSPMLALSGQMNTRQEPTFSHQNVDHNQLFAPITKWVTRMVPEAAGPIMRKALRTAVAERPGPVHITIPTNVGTAPAEDDGIALPPLTPAGGVAQVFHGGGDGDAARRLAGARRPVVVAGMAALRAKAGPALRAFAEATGTPVVVSPKAKGVVPENHAYFAGTIDMACNAYIWEFLESADLILCAGFDAVELIKPWRLSVPVIHMDAVPNTDQIYPACVELVGHLPAMLEDLTESAGGAAKWSEKDVRVHRDGLSERYYAGRIAGKLNPTDVVDAVRDAFPPETVITMDVGSHKLLVGQGWTAHEPGTVLLTNGLSSMGFALPGAITAKLLRPDRPVVCFTGDGGFAMVESELRLASSLGLGVVVVVFGDNSLNRIEIKQAAKQFAIGSTRFEPSDLVKIAEAQDCHGEQVHDRKALDAVLARAHDLDRPLVIDARIDPAQYTAHF